MERFCATCGTRLEPPAESCPCCGRQMDWDTASQPLSFVKQESASSSQLDTSSSDGKYPEEKAVGSNSPIETEPMGVSKPAEQEDSVENGRCDLQKEYLLAQPAPAPLEFSEAVVMCIYAMVPIAGLILLTLAMLFGNEENQNRRTLAKALLVAHLGLMLLLVVGWFALRPLVVSYMMSGYGTLG